ncbi:unnamed protein product [Amoebophrya sp. A25]|nr:unnamed protein product [Amoebophrya sp. A25]|eukprot:GSA25T00010933001.1
MLSVRKWWEADATADLLDPYGTLEDDDFFDHVEQSRLPVVGNQVLVDGFMQGRRPQQDATPATQPTPASDSGWVYSISDENSASTPKGRTSSDNSQKDIDEQDEKIIAILSAERATREKMRARKYILTDNGYVTQAPEVSTSGAVLGVGTTCSLSDRTAVISYGPFVPPAFPPAAVQSSTENSSHTYTGSSTRLLPAESRSAPQVVQKQSSSSASSSSTSAAGLATASSREKNVTSVASSSTTSTTSSSSEMTPSRRSSATSSSNTALRPGAAIGGAQYLPGSPDGARHRTRSRLLSVRSSPGLDTQLRKGGIIPLLHVTEDEVESSTHDFSTKTTSTTTSSSSGGPVFLTATNKANYKRNNHVVRLDLDEHDRTSARGEEAGGQQDNDQYLISSRNLKRRGSPLDSVPRTRVASARNNHS